MLFATGTTLSVPALTGAIMCMGVATANSVLVISFARERLDILRDPVAAALEAGFVRIRPVLMTALAMIIGMAPMALGLGDGGEQNAPLGRGRKKFRRKERRTEPRCAARAIATSPGRHLGRHRARRGRWRGCNPRH
jgi:hypothetical protein